jgi:hypothetical protein
VSVWVLELTAFLLVMALVSQLRTALVFLLGWALGMATALLLEWATQ